MKRKVMAVVTAVALALGGAVVTAGPASAASAKCPNNAMSLRIVPSGIYNATAHNCSHYSMRIKLRTIAARWPASNGWTQCKTVGPRQAVTFSGGLLYPVDVSGRYYSC